MTLLIIAAVIAATTLIARLLLPLITWTVELVEAKHRYRHARRRRNRAKGFIPIFDDRWEPPTEWRP